MYQGRFKWGNSQFSWEWEIKLILWANWSIQGWEHEESGVAGGEIELESTQRDDSHWGYEITKGGIKQNCIDNCFIQQTNIYQAFYL